MSSPQDSRARHRQKRRRALKNEAWQVRKDAADAASAQPKSKAKKTT